MPRRHPPNYNRTPLFAHALYCRGVLHRYATRGGNTGTRCPERRQGRLRDAIDASAVTGRGRIRHRSLVLGGQGKAEVAARSPAGAASGFHASGSGAFGELEASCKSRRFGGGTVCRRHRHRSARTAPGDPSRASARRGPALFGTGAAVSSRGSRPALRRSGCSGPRSRVRRARPWCAAAPAGPCPSWTGPPRPPCPWESSG